MSAILFKGRTKPPDCLPAALWIFTPILKDYSRRGDGQASFCSCNPSGPRQTLESIWCPSLPTCRYPKFSLSELSINAVASSAAGCYKFKSARSHHSSPCCVKLLCSPYNLNMSILYGILPPRKSSQQVIFSHAPCRLNTRGWKFPSLQSISWGKRILGLEPGSPTYPEEKGHGLEAILVSKVSSGSPHNHPAASRCITSIQIVVCSLHPSKNCQHLALQLNSSQGLFCFALFRFRKKNHMDEFCAVYPPALRICW